MKYLRSLWIVAVYILSLPYSHAATFDFSSLNSVMPATRTFHPLAADPRHTNVEQIDKEGTFTGTDGEVYWESSPAIKRAYLDDQNTYHQVEGPDVFGPDAYSLLHLTGKIDCLYGDNSCMDFIGFYVPEEYEITNIVTSISHFSIDPEYSLSAYSLELLAVDEPHELATAQQIGKATFDDSVLYEDTFISEKRNLKSDSYYNFNFTDLIFDAKEIGNEIVDFFSFDFNIIVIGTGSQPSQDVPEMDASTAPLALALLLSIFALRRERKEDSDIED